jgi:hypothetical protein
MRHSSSLQGENSGWRNRPQMGGDTSQNSDRGPEAIPVMRAARWIASVHNRRNDINSTIWNLRGRSVVNIIISCFIH